MGEEYIKEKKIVDKTDKEWKKELIKSIILAREELNELNKNFEYADKDMVDYYTYQLKANQSKIDYLTKFAKNKGISLDMIDAVKMKIYIQRDEVV